MRLTHVHTVLRFPQKAWIAPYIDLNSQLRATTVSEFEKDFYKLLNNSVYGKTMQNERRYTDMHLLTEGAKALALSQKPHCKHVRMFEPNLVAVEMLKTRQTITKPFEVGFAVLELSKLLMYRFHYEHIKQKYG